MNDRQTQLEERRRLEQDIAGRHRLKTIDEVDELLLRIEDAAAGIKFDLECEVSYPATDQPDPRRADWRQRAMHALAKMEFAIRQVTKRRDLLARQEQRK